MDQHFAKVLDYHSIGREVFRGYKVLHHPFTKWMRNVRGLRAKPALVETCTRKMGKQPEYSLAVQEAKMVFGGIKHAIERSISISGNVTDASTGASLVADIALTNKKFSQKEKQSPSLRQRMQLL